MLVYILELVPLTLLLSKTCLFRQLLNLLLFFPAPSRCTVPTTLSPIVADSHCPKSYYSIEDPKMSASVLNGLPLTCWPHVTGLSPW